MKETIDMEKQIINNIKSLGIDMINQAGSGHPGIVLGAAPIMYTLYAKHLNISIADHEWINRDRFVLSAGHGSALLYATLYLAGYNISLEDIKNFRRIGYKTPGHPENFITPGVDMTTGPLGQGIASAVGMAIAAKNLSSQYQLPREEKLFAKTSSLFDYRVYVLCGDGDLMEGISYEAASLAGTLGLNNLIILYDSNNISLDGDIKYSFTENVRERFKAMNFDTFFVKDGNDINAVDKAIKEAKSSSKPAFIEIKTIIGEGSSLAGTSEVHGKLLSADDMKQLKANLAVPSESFTVPDNVITSFRTIILKRSQEVYGKWADIYNLYSKNYPVKIEMLKKSLNNDVTTDLTKLEWNFQKDMKEATRITNGEIMVKLASIVPNLIGGSADLSSSVKTYLYKQPDIAKDNFDGKNIWYGVREHAMGAITNGLALSGFRPFCSTFLVFSDYLKPAIRMAAIMNIPSIFIFSHDSINIGQDGPTHQPIEQLAMLRSIPNLSLFRPADANEIVGSWNVILNSKNPSCLILSRADVNLLEHSNAALVAKGAYIVKKEINKIDAIIISTGSEVQTSINIANDFYRENGIDIRVVSMPNRELFLSQDSNYQEMILPKGYKKFVVEAGSSFGWHGFVYNENYLITVNQFGISGTKDEVLAYCKFNYEQIKNRIKNVL